MDSWHVRIDIIWSLTLDTLVDSSLRGLVTWRLSILVDSSLAVPMILQGKRFSPWYVWSTKFMWKYTGCFLLCGMYLHKLRIQSDGTWESRDDASLPLEVFWGAVLGQRSLYPGACCRCRERLCVTWCKPTWFFLFETPNCFHLRDSSQGTPSGGFIHSSASRFMMILLIPNFPSMHDLEFSSLLGGIFHHEDF